MMLGIDGELHVVADTGTATALRYRAAVGIGQGDLLIGRSKHLLFVDIKLAHLGPQLCQLLGEPCYLRGQRLRRFLPVGRVELAQIARDALLQKIADEAERGVLCAVDRKQPVPEVESAEPLNSN